jgi:hypothetical protein
VQAIGRKVLVAQFGRADEDDQWIEPQSLQRRQLLVSGLDLSAARILQLGPLQAPPQKGVLWLEQWGAAAKWGLMSPGLVVLVSPRAQVRTGCRSVAWPARWVVMIAQGAHRTTATLFFFSSLPVGLAVQWKVTCCQCNCQVQLQARLWTQGCASISQIGA